MLGLRLFQTGLLCRAHLLPINLLYLIVVSISLFTTVVCLFEIEVALVALDLNLGEELTGHICYDVDQLTT